MKTGSWREALDIIPADGRKGCSVSLLDISESARGCCLRHVFSGALLYVILLFLKVFTESWGWENSVNSTFFFFFLKSNLILICPICISVVLFPQCCLMKCWVKKHHLGFFCLSVCKEVQYFDLKQVFIN